MLDVQADLGGLLGPLVAGLILIGGASAVLRSSQQGPARGRHRAHGTAARANATRRTRRPRPAVPAPLTGAAVGLLESIPYLEPVRRKRLRGTMRLGTTLLIAGSFVAAALFFLGRTLVNWLNSFQP